MRIDRQSETWLEVEAWARAELASCMARLKNPRTSVDETNALRGEIKALEELLALPDPKATPKIAADVSYHT